MALHLFLWCCWILASPWHSCVEGIWWKLSKQRFDAMTTFALWEFHIQVAFCGGDARLLAMHGRWDCRQKKLLILRQSLRALESWDEERGCCTYIWPYIDMYIYICDYCVWVWILRCVTMCLQQAWCLGWWMMICLPRWGGTRHCCLPWSSLCGCVHDCLGFRKHQPSNTCFDGGGSMKGFDKRMGMSFWGWYIAKHIDRFWIVTFPAYILKEIFWGPQQSWLCWACADSFPPLAGPWYFKTLLKRVPNIFSELKGGSCQLDSKCPVHRWLCIMYSIYNWL